MTTQQLTSSEFRRFQEFIYQNSGIRVPDTRKTLLSNRIRRRLKAGSFADFRTYYEYLTSQSGQEELEEFLDVVTTNETFFFRTRKHFEWFGSEFISEMIQRARRGERPKSLRVWSAACSTGEEPYSLAICLLQNQLRLRDWTLEIVGTDLSRQVLQDAQAGLYRERSMEQLTDAQRRRYFRRSKDSDHWQIRSNAADLVRFQRHNLTQRLHLPPFDCIFIRNVLIYFDRDSRQTVVEQLVRALNPGGYLVTGPSEGIFDMLGMLTRRSSFLYQKE